MTRKPRQKAAGRGGIKELESRRRRFRVSFARRYRNKKYPSSCPVCAMILDAFRNPLDVKVDLGKVSDILDIDCPHTKWIGDTKYLGGSPGDELVPVFNYRQCNLILEKDKDDYASLRVETENDANLRTLHKFGLIRREDRLDHPGLLRAVDVKWIDLDVARKWYARCVREHALCEWQLWMQGQVPEYPDWLIDVDKACLVPFDTAKKNYFALSYTWGQTRNLRNTKAVLPELKQMGALNLPKFSSQIPNTIRHAIYVTQTLGERYLWVDSLCMVQDDEEFMVHALSKMHLIYAGCALCIVAGEGQDADFGLRGLKDVSERRWLIRLSYDLANGEKIGTLFPLKHDGDTLDMPVLQHNRGRSYLERAWTFQEFMFARRRLIFGLHELRFSCGSQVEWREDWADGREWSGAGGKPFGDTKESRDWMYVDIPDLAVLDSVVEPFNKRRLTFPEDVSRAFSGIQSQLHRIYPGGLLFGIPEFFFDIALFWDAAGEPEVERRRPSARCKSSKYGTKLPSWSWMGWHSESLTFPVDREFRNPNQLPSHKSNSWPYGFTEPITTWYTMATPLSLERRPIKSQWFRYRMEAQDPQSELPEGWTRHDNVPDSEEDTQLLPLKVPSFYYTHSRSESKFWYPVPVLSRDQIPELSDQTQYLSCVTSRAYLDMRPRVLGSDLLDTDGGKAGYLYDTPTNWEDLFAGIYDRETPLIRVELVAICRGWTQGWDDTSQEQMDWEPPVHSHVHNTEPGGAFQAPRPRPVNKKGVYDARDELLAPNEATMSRTRSRKAHCYFVFWIKWDNGVAQRQAPGYVYAETWERCREEVPVNLVLG